MSVDTIRVVALMEAASITGPAKNLIEFASRAKEPLAGLPGIEITIVTYNRAPGDSTFTTAAKSAGLRTHTIFERGRFDTAVLPALRRAIAAEQPDMVQSHNVKSHFLVRLLGIHNRLPWIAFNHGYTATSTLDRTYSQLDYWSLRAAFRAVVVCGPFARAIERRGVRPDRIHIQHNSVRRFVPSPQSDVEAVRRELGIGVQPVLLAVGRLSKEKAHADLLDAIAILRREHGAPDFRTVLVGDGPERSNLLAQASRLGLRDTVIMAGHRTDTRPFYTLATMLVLPSHTEGSPNVVLEAMAAGVPVVAAAVGGVPEILENQRTGLLFSSRDPAAMGAAIHRLLTEPQTRNSLATAARCEVEAHYTPEAYHASMASFYQQVLQDWARQRQ